LTLKNTDRAISFYIVSVIVLGVLYFLSAKIGISINTVSSHAALIWAPTGLAISALLIFGIRLWPAVFLGALFINMFTGTSVVVSSGIAVGNTLEAVVAAWLLLRSRDFHKQLDRYRDVWRFFVFAALLNTLISASTGVLSLYLGHRLEESLIIKTAITWWVGDVLGAVIFVPLFLGLSSVKDIKRRPWQWSLIVEKIVFTTVLISICIFVFDGILRTETSLTAFPFLLIVPLIWSAVRFGSFGATLTNFAISIFAVWSTAIGKGPFTGGFYLSDILSLLVFGLSISAVSLIVSSIVSELESAKERAESASKTKSAFLANMSHEIRTPLGVVVGFAELLADPNLPIERRNELQLAIKRNGELLTHIIGGVLDLSKIEAGHFQIEKVRFSLPEFLQNCLVSLQIQARAKDVSLDLKLKTKIPIFVYSDPMRLRQIIFNIVANAIKFTNKGSVTVDVETVFAEDKKIKLRIVVADQGIGISADIAKKLFRPFMQASESNTRKFGGTGLGLSLSKSLAQRLGGDVELLRSEPNKGSIFVIVVDIETPADTTYTEELELKTSLLDPPSTAHEQHYLDGVNILVVDDSIDNQVLLSIFLSAAGAKVTCADNGEQGVEKALSGNFDIILMDISMPVLDGLQATQRLRNNSYKKPIIALTAFALKEERDRSLASGFDDHLTKPIDQKELIYKIAKFANII
jgi:signal transduction histidine kinase/CheY-like chemotaxis protein